MITCTEGDASFFLIGHAVDPFDLLTEETAILKKVSISITGGRDSTTTLACANGLYDRFHYFSYISNEAERYTKSMFLPD